MFCTLLLAKEHYPKDMPIVSFDHTDNASYYAIRKSQTQAKAGDIGIFIDALPFADFELPQTCATQECIDFCEATGREAPDFYLFNGFLQAYLDPMTAFYRKDNGNYMSYALRFNENTEGSQKMADLLQTLVYELRATGEKRYSAVAVAGFEGVLAIQHENAKQFAAFTKVEDCSVPDGSSELPAYDEQVFRAHVQAYLDHVKYPEQATAANEHMADYLLATNGAVIVGDLRLYLTNAHYYTSTIISVGDYDGTVGFYNGEYERVAQLEEDAVVIAQSSCEANLTNFIASDFRMVQVERGVSVKTDISLDDFQMQMRIFPFRTSQTPSMFTVSHDSQVATLQRCVEVFDGSTVVACADPSPPASWWSITLSLIVMIATIVCWVFGCKVSKKMEEKELVEQE